VCAVVASEEGVVAPKLTIPFSSPLYQVRRSLLDPASMAARMPKQEDVLSSPPYKDEVLGREVSILFENEEDGGRMDYYRGVVRRVTFSLQPNGDITYEHFVQFDDGDESWFDLEAEEKAGRLQWSTADDAKPPSKKVKKESDAEESEEEEKHAEDDKTSSNDEPQLQDLPNEIPSSVDANSSQLGESLDGEADGSSRNAAVAVVNTTCDIGSVSSLSTSNNTVGGNSNEKSLGRS